jgi:hypothetical protein
MMTTFQIISQANQQQPSVSADGSATVSWGLLPSLVIIGRCFLLIVLQLRLVPANVNLYLIEDKIVGKLALMAQPLVTTAAVGGEMQHTTLCCRLSPGASPAAAAAAAGCSAALDSGCCCSFQQHARRTGPTPSITQQQQQRQCCCYRQ